ncbi:hypothetical protein [Streptomyces abikoensis]
MRQRVRVWLGRFLAGLGRALDRIERRHKALMVIATFVAPIIAVWASK